MLAPPGAADQSSGPAQEAELGKLLKRTLHGRNVDARADGNGGVRRIQPTIVAEHIAQGTADVGSADRQTTWSALKLQLCLPLGALLAIEPDAWAIAEDRITVPFTG